MKGNSTEDRLVRFLFDLAPHTAITRHVPGRIKITFQASGVRLLRSAGIQGLSRPLPGIRKARVGFLSKAVDIEYDPDLIPFDLWEALARLEGDDGDRDGLAKRLKGLLRRQRLGPAPVSKRKGI